MNYFFLSYTIFTPFFSFLSVYLDYTNNCNNNKWKIKRKPEYQMCNPHFPIYVTAGYRCFLNNSPPLVLFIETFVFHFCFYFYLSFCVSCVIMDKLMFVLVVVLIKKCCSWFWKKTFSVVFIWKFMTI